MSNRRKLPGLAAAEEPPGLLGTLVAPPGQPCTWCNCRTVDPVQVPGGPAMFFGHDDDACPGCDRGAAFVVQLRVPFLGMVYQLPVCPVHRGDAEADLARQFPGGGQ